MWPVIAALIAVSGWVMAVGVCIKAGYLAKALAKLGLKENKAGMNWTAFSWESCLQKMGCSAQTVFFGDSLIRGGDFHKAFPEEIIVNLGCSGDTLAGMRNRLSTVQMLTPKKVFFMGGINGLTDYNLSQCVRQYAALLNQLKRFLPDAEIYIHSLLPIAKNKERTVCSNKTIRQFNDEIRGIAQAEGIAYIDLYPCYEKNGQLDSALTVDGIHLKPEAYEHWFRMLNPYMNASFAGRSAKDTNIL